MSPARARVAALSSTGAWAPEPWTSISPISALETTMSGSRLAVATTGTGKVRRLSGECAGAGAEVGTRREDT